MISSYALSGLLLYLSVGSSYSKENYEARADDFMDKMLKDVYLGKYQKGVLTTTNATPKTGSGRVLWRTTPKLRDAGIKKYYSSTIPTNMSIKDLGIRKREIDIMTVMDSQIAHIPDFRSQDDEITVQTRRFEDIQNYEKKHPALREYYFHFDNGTRIYIEKKRVVNIMAQMLYQTRYQLPYAQLLRRKHKKLVKYKLGYCFALLRNLKNQQMMIYNTMQNYHEIMPTLFSNMKFYEKVVRLDIDIHDLLKYLKVLDKKRKDEAEAAFLELMNSTHRTTATGSISIPINLT